MSMIPVPRNMKIQSMNPQMKIEFFTDEEISKENLLELEPEELQQKVTEKLKLNMNNGHPQKVIPINELRKYIEEGWEYIRDLGDKEAIVRLPNNQ